MQKQLEEILKKYTELTDTLNDPQTARNPQRLQEFHVLDGKRGLQPLRGLREVFADHEVRHRHTIGVERFETAEEFLLALERGASRPLNAPQGTPLMQRDPSFVWKLATFVLGLVNLLLVYWLLFLPK